MKSTNFYQQSIKEVVKELSANLKSGLSEQESTQRLREYGPNILPEKDSDTALIIFVRQFLSPLMIILLIASLACVLIQKVEDASVIGIAVLLNVILGFIQEWKAEQAAKLLKSHEVQHCIVIRDETKQTIKSQKLVPGDLVVLTAGDKVPADIRLTNSVDLKINEALLTGESEAAKKNTDIINEPKVLGDQTNMAFLGTFVVQGKATGIVTATANQTQLGQIADLTTQKRTHLTPIQKQLKSLSRFLGILMIGLVALVFSVGLIRGFYTSFTFADLKELIALSIALAVAAVPEGLVVGVTVILAIGMQRMLKRKALVKKLVAAETLGSVSVICTDKTGTLTKGHLSVVRMITSQNDITDFESISSDIQELLKLGVLNNDASYSPKQPDKKVGEPTELALVEAAYLAGLDVTKIRAENPRISEIPFSSAIKYMATVHQTNDTQTLVVKGAPEVVLSMCTLPIEQRNKLQERVDNYTEKGFRLLAIAQNKNKIIELDGNPKNLSFVGLCIMADALRPTTQSTIQKISNAGIKTILVTGDHLKTAQYIAKQAGILVHENSTLTGTEIDTLSDNELKNKITTVSVIARVNPHHKVRIVEAWQANKHFVAMIGDGVNDAPAIRRADIGVAVGSGSDITHDTADMILLDNNLETIAAAVYEGRTIFDNIRKMLVYLLVDCFSEIVLIGGAFLIGLPSPLHALQVLWINLISDGPPSIALSFEPGEPAIMTEKPRPQSEPLFNQEMKVLTFIIGTITDVGLFGLYLVLRYLNYTLSHSQTIIFTALAIDSLLYVFSVRSLRTSLFHMNIFKNKWLVPSVLLGLFTQLAVIYVPFLQKLFHTVPLSLMEWGVIVPLALIKITAIELTKSWYNQRSTQ